MNSPKIHTGNSNFQRNLSVQKFPQKTAKKKNSIAQANTINISILSPDKSSSFPHKKCRGKKQHEKQNSQWKKKLKYSLMYTPNFSSLCFFFASLLLSAVFCYISNGIYIKITWFYLWKFSLFMINTCIGFNVKSIQQRVGQVLLYILGDFTQGLPRNYVT